MSHGFKFAPVTYSLLIFSSFGTFILSRGYVSQLRQGIDVASIARGSFGRLLFNGISFPSYPQVICSAILLYNFRQFERQMGSWKFGSFVAVSFVLSTLTQLGFAVTASSMGFPLTLSAGPYFLVFSLLACYHKLVPKLNPSKANISSLVFSEKSWIYFLAIQLWFSEGNSSFLAGLSGLLTGYMYLSDVLGVQRVRLPTSIANLFSPFSALFGPTAASVLPNGPTPSPLQQPQSNRRNNDRNGQNPFIPRRDMGFHGGGFPQHHMTPSPPSEEAIDTLVNLGFERDRVIRALQSRDNNIEAAANSLLSGND